MATYAVGDIQGCFQALEKLLREIQFSTQNDQLWICGDLVSRGPDSLATLRFIRQLGPCAKVVLGNHDLHLLAAYYGLRDSTDTLEETLKASDAAELMLWLRQQPLLYYQPALNFCMTHAGIAPEWSLPQALERSNEVCQYLQGPHVTDFLSHMYGNQPNQWSDSLQGYDRARLITNYFTRMRFLTPAGALDLAYKGDTEESPSELIPWFDFPRARPFETRIVFGHWAALGGKFDRPDVFGVDTGCVWGGCLTALRLEDLVVFKVSCG